MLLRDFGEDVVRESLTLASVLGYTAPAPETVDDILSRGLAFKLSDLRLTGRDLISLGARGPEVGRILEHLLDDVIDGNIENEKAMLLERAIELVSTTN